MKATISSENPHGVKPAVNRPKEPSDGDTSHRRSIGTRSDKFGASLTTRSFAHRRDFNQSRHEENGSTLTYLRRPKIKRLGNLEYIATLILAFICLPLLVLPVTAATLTHSTLIGAVTDTSANIWMRSDVAVSSAVVQYQLAGGNWSQPSQSAAVSLTAANDFTGAVSLTNLSPATLYDYRILLDGVVQPTGTATFKTFPASGTGAQFTFVFGADMQQDQRPHTIFGKIGTQQPDFAVFLGDNVYSDIPAPAQTEADFWTAYKTNRDAWFQSFVNHTPVFTIWDDHDYGIDNADSTYPLKKLSRAAFGKYWANPTYVEQNASIYYKFSVADVDFFMLDSRWNRVLGKTMLGATQLQWLKDGLLASTAKFKFIVSPDIVSDLGTTGSDAWSGYPAERASIFQHIAQNNIKNVIFLTGDQHWAGAFLISYPIFQIGHGIQGFYEIEPTPLSARKRTAPHQNPSCQCPDPQILFEADQDNYYGLARVDTTVVPRQIQFEIHRGSDDAIVYSLTVEEFTPTQAPAIATSFLPQGTLNNSYSQTLSAVDGVAPYQWSLFNGALPSGLTLSPSGVISGVPTQSGTFFFTVNVQDTALSTNRRTFSLTINSAATGPNLSQDFSGTTLSAWTIVDEGANEGPSKWLLSNGQLIQQSNIWGGADSGADPVKPGTYAYAGNLSWTDYEFSVSVLSQDDDAVGVMFRYRNFQNYYRFSMDQQRSYRRLTKIVNGVTTILAQDAVAYQSNRSYAIKIRVIGNTIQVYVDGALVFNVTDSSISSGMIGLYSWANVGSFFDNVTVTSPSLAILTSSVAMGSVGVQYNQNLSASGGISPYNWSLASGSLPQGLSLSANGILSGTPVAIGTSTFSVQVQDSSSPARTATRSFTLTVTPPIPTTGLVGFWNFDDGTANDKSGNGNNGTLVSNPGVVAGKVGFGLSLDGGSQYVNLGNVLNPGTGDLSVFAWVKTTQVGGFNMIVSKRNSSGSTNPGYQLFQNSSGAISFTFNDGNSARVRVDSTGPRINDGNWHSVGVVFSRSGNGVMYVDGAAAPGGSGSITSQSGNVTNSLPLRFGVEDQTGSGFFWNGLIDEVRIYTRALSAQEALSIFTGTVPGSANPTPLAIVTNSLPNGTANVAYPAQALTASGGVSPYTWNMQTGSLPQGLSLSSTGTISGTPTAAGNSNFIVQVKDSTLASTTQSLNLTINPGVASPTISLGFDGKLRDRVGQNELSLNSDGQLDGVFTVTLNVGSGNRTVSSMRLNRAGAVGVWDTQAGNGFWTLGVASGLDTALLNAANDSVNFALTEGSSFKIFAADFQNQMFLVGSAFTLIVNFADGSTATGGATVTAAQPLTIVTNSLPNATATVAYSPQTLTASGGTAPYNWSIISGTLPQGLSLSTSGTISGAPTTAGTSTLLVQVRDSAFVTATRSFNLTINPPPLTIVTNALPNGTATVAYAAQTLTASGGVPPYTWNVQTGSLPQGLSLSTSGTISGTPTTAGTSTVTVQVKDSLLTSATQQFNLTINPPPLTIVTTALPNGTATVAYTAQTLTASGGIPPYTWNVQIGSLPQGLSLSQTGTISGTPTAAGTSTFTMQVKDNVLTTSSQQFNLTVNAGVSVPTISLGFDGKLRDRVGQAELAPSPDGQLDGVFTVTLNAGSGNRTVSSMRLNRAGPVGVWDTQSVNGFWTLGAANGLDTTLLNAASDAVNFVVSDGSSFKIFAADFQNQMFIVGSGFTLIVNFADGSSATGNVAVTTAQPLTVATSSLPSGTATLAYPAQTLTASGGTTPYNWSIVSGALPQGLSLSSSGTISGTPTTAGTSTFLVQVRDNASVTATQSFNVTVNPPPLSIMTTSLPNGTATVAYAPQTLVASGGVPPYTWSVISGALPQGLTLSSAGTLSGTPLTAETTTFTVQAKDSSVLPAITQALSLTVNGAAPSVFTAGLIGYWSFDDGTGADNSGNGSSGALINNPNAVAGKLGQALNLNGTSQYVNVNNISNPGSGDLSIFAWVKTTQAGAFNMIVSKRNSSASTNPGYQLFQNSSGAASFTFADGNSTRVRVDSTGPRINDGNWHYVGVVFARAGNGVIYVDGVAATNGAASITSQSGNVSNTLPLRFGLEDQTNQGFYWTGGIDEVRIYNRAFSAPEVSTLYIAQNPATLSLHYEGTLRDRVGQAEFNLNPDGQLDGVFTVTLVPGSGNRTITRLQLNRAGQAGIWNTQANDGFWSLGAATTLDSPLLNAADDSVNFAVSDGGSFKIFAADFAGLMFVPGSSFMLRVNFADTSTASANVSF